MKKLSSILKVTIIVIALIFSADVFAESKPFSNAPTLKKNGKKWRIGYLEGGPYQNYPKNLKSVLRGLMDLGWIQSKKIPNFKDPDDTDEMWSWMSKNLKSKYLSFSKKNYYSANWDDKLRKKIKKKVLAKLKKRKIDFMIAMGTAAGKDLANNQHKIPVMVVSSTDPIAAGIIKSVKDSGFNHVHARVDPTRYERQVQLFHDIIGFSKLGVAYSDTEAGRSYAAIKDIEKVAKARGFKIERCYTLDEIGDSEKEAKSVVDCMDKLSKNVDAVYITIQNGVTTKNMGNIIKHLNKYNIPTFSQGSSDEVRYGALLSIAQAGFIYVGKFHAEVMAKILNGAKPRKVRQIYENPPKIAINLAQAQRIGYDPPVDILGVADEIYQEVEVFTE